MEKPIGKAIILCDEVIEDKRSGKKTLVNIFNRLGSKKFPTKHPRMCVYVALVNGSGEMPVKLQLKRSDGEKPKAMFTAEGQVKFQNPNQVIELVYDLRGLVFLAAGVYTFEVYADSDFIFETKFNVVTA